MHLIKQLIIYVAVLSIILVIADACGCMYYDARTSACNSDFVMKARIRSSRIKSGRNYKDQRKIYNVGVRDTFRALDGVQSLIKSSKMNITTFPNRCETRAVDLIKGQDYVLTGRIIHGRAIINYCDFHHRWNKLTVEQIQGLSSEYYFNCQTTHHNPRYSRRN